MYGFDQEIIHDKQAMWYVAVSFKCRYEFLKEQLSSYKKDRCILYKGDLVFERRDKKLFEKILRQYKNDLAAIERVIEQDIRLNAGDEEHYVKYVHTV